MDLFSRMVVGRAARPTIHRELVLDAVLMAVRARRPRDTLIHSDQGTQFGSDAWRRFCFSHRLEPSMSRKGNCWDNAVAEAFFGSVKKELIKKQIYQSRDVATAVIADYIETSTIVHADTAISAVSALNSSNPLTSSGNRVSTESWDLQDVSTVMGRERPRHPAPEVSPAPPTRSLTPHLSV